MNPSRSNKDSEVVQFCKFAGCFFALVDFLFLVYFLTLYTVGKL